MAALLGALAGFPVVAGVAAGGEGGAATEGEPFEHAIVTVNGRAITSSYLALRMGERLAELERIKAERVKQGLWGKRDGEMYERALLIMRAQVIRNVVFGEILRAEADRLVKAGMQIPERAVEQYWRQMLERAGGPAALAREQGLSLAALRELAQDDILAEAYRHNLRQSLAVPTPQEVADYYRYNSEDFRRPEAVRARAIFVSRLLEEPGSGRRVERKDARGRAGEILARLRAGEDFARAARRYSDDLESSALGGLLGSAERRFLIERRESSPQFEPVLYEALFRLPAGELSDVIEGPGHFYIVMIEDHYRAGVPPLGEIEEDVRNRCYADRVRQIEDELFRSKFSRVLVVDANGRRLSLEELWPETKGRARTLFDPPDEEDLD
jgi:hypothetical protein